MKAIPTVMVLAVVMVLLAGSVSAALEATNLQLGGKRQRASNPLAKDAVDRDEILTGTISLSNTDTVNAVSNIVATVTEESKFSGKLNVTLENVPTTLSAAPGPGNSATVTVRARVPENLDAVDAKLAEAGFKVATLTFSGNASGTPVTISSTLTMQRENQLVIDNVEVCVNDRCKNVDDNDDVKGIRPGDRIKLTFKVENKYSDSKKEDLDIENVQFEYEIDDDDFNENDDEDLDDIGPEDEEEISFSFSVEDDVKDGTYDLVARVVGSDENGALHGEEINIDLEVERKTHEIDIRGAIAIPNRLACGAFQGRASVSFVNIGRRDEDEVALELVQPELGIQERVGLFSLDEDDSRSENIPFKVSENAKPGLYTFVVRSFYDTSVQSDEEPIEVTVPDCATPEEPKETVTTPVVAPPVVQPPVENVPVVRPPVVQQQSFTESPLYVALLALGSIVVLAMLVFLIVRFTGRQEL